ncbi:MAG: sodium:glutamate symporter [Oscillospiraceae bacterium]|nr:sodium:glutamate symporter [Oscillospiraceae bacterium]
MIYSANDTALWNFIIQFGIIAAVILAANFLRRKIPFIRKSLMPTAVLAGFILLILRSLNILPLNLAFLEMITYHGIAFGFIAMSLRITEKPEGGGSLTGAKSGALIVSTYLVQAVTGLVITLFLAYTVMPDLFKAAGILLPMGYGQGPGQANNIGGAYEALGFAGGRSFALSIAAAGYLVACIAGIAALNIFARRGKIKRIEHDEISGSVTIDTFQDKDELPVSESLDRLSIQFAMVIIVYLLTYLAISGVTSFFSAVSEDIAATVNSLFWGFNFIIASALALLARFVLGKLRRSGIITKQYQNNYLLGRISGLAFDLMIIAGIASIEISDLTGLWVPFALSAVFGGIVTWIYLSVVCKKIYPGYYYEGYFSMFGMMTGTISSGVLLLREIDPEYKTPAANNLVVGSTFGIVFGAPMLILVGLAPKSDIQCLLTLGLCVLYLIILLLFMYKANRRKP